MTNATIMPCASLMSLAIASGSPLPDRTIKPASATLNRAFADNEAGHDQHAEALGGFTPQLCLATARSKNQPVTAPMTTGRGDGARQVDRQADAERRQAVAAVAAFLERKINQNQHESEQGAIHDQIPAQVAADDAPWRAWKSGSPEVHPRAGWKSRSGSALRQSRSHG